MKQVNYVKNIKPNFFGFKISSSGKSPIKNKSWLVNIWKAYSGAIHCIWLQVFVNQKSSQVAQ